MLLFAALAGCAARNPVVTNVASPAPARAEPPLLVVTLVVDQLGAWVADARLPLLPSDGGFARLRREGTWAHRVVYPYAVTDTAPGHATMYTGRVPHDSGIYGNELVDAQGSRISFLRDDQTRLIASTGQTNDVGSSITRLRVPTLADELRDRRSDASIVSISLKDRGAIFGGGRHSGKSVV